MIRLTKEFKFEMAHALDGYDGDCRNIHGHSFKLWVTIIGEPIHQQNSPKNGMLIDFGDLKRIVRDAIVDPFDHALLINENAKYSSLFASSVEPFGKLVFVPFQPTSENLLDFMAKKLIPLLPAHVKLHSLKLHETITSYAEWYADDNIII